jgi:hypothetical protein
MKSSKWMIGLLAVALVLSLAPSSFAQIQISVSNPPSGGEIQTNNNAQVSDPTNLGNGLTVSGQLLAQSNLTATTLTITFPGPISSTGPTPGVPAADPVQIVAGAGLFAAGNVSIGTINYAKGTISLFLPNATNNTLSGSFRLVGIRINVNGKAAPLNATFGLDNAANNYILLNSTVPVISALGPGIATVAQGAISGQTNGGTFLVFTNQTSGTPSGPNASLVLTEGFASAWRTATQSSSFTSIAGSDPNGAAVRLTVLGIPKGMSILVSAATPSSLAVNLSSTTLSPVSNSSPNANQTLITFSKTSLTTVESLQLNFVLSGTPGATLTAGTLTASVTMAPVGTGLDSNGNPTESGGNYPTFTEADLGPVTIGTIAVANTTLLVPYAVVTGPYDTGIEIANTTADPFGVIGGGATPTNGTLTFTLMPSNATRTGAGTPITVTTSSTKLFGQGLDSSGNLDAGAVFTANVGADILPAAGVSAASGFFGYIWIQANFLDAHGVSFVYNGAGFTSASPVIVLPPPGLAGSTRNAPTSGVESLNN